MKNSQLLILAAVLAVLVALIVGRDAYQTYKDTQPNEFRQAVANLSMDTLSSVTLQKGDEVVEMMNDDGVWMVATKSADRAMIEDLVLALTPVNNPLLISESEQQKEALGVDETQGTTVELRGNGYDLSFVVGDKKGSSNPVALGDKIFAVMDMPKLRVDPDRWVDLVIVDAEDPSIKAVTWDGFGLIRADDNSWTFEDGSGDKVNQDEVTTLLKEFNPLSAKALAYEHDQAEYDTRTADFTVKLVKTDDSVTTIEFYQGGNDYLAKRLENEEYFLVTGDDGDNLDRSREDFVEVTE